jgi:hypothetical protein
VTPTSLRTNVAEGTTGRLAEVNTLHGAVNELTNATTGTVVKGELVINVKDYGAVGDGIANDAVAINAAIVAAGNGEVFLPAGTYLVNSELVTTNTGSSIRGVGEKSVIQLGATGARLRINTIRVRLSNFRVNGNNVATNGVLYSNGSRGTAFAVRVYDCLGSGWLVKPGFAPGGSCNLIVLTRCEAVSNDGHGFEVADDPTAIDATNFTLTDCEASSNLGHGALLRDSLPQVRGGMYISNTLYGIQLGVVGDVLATSGPNIDHPRLEGNTSGPLSEGSSTKALIALHDSYSDSGSYQVTSGGNNWRLGYSGSNGGFTMRESSGVNFQFRNTDGSIRVAPPTGANPSLQLTSARGFYTSDAATPEGTITANTGSVCMTRVSPFAVWRKVTGSGNTGWRRLGSDSPIKDNGGANYTATDADEIILAYGTTTITLPAPATAGAGRKYTVKNISTGTITVTPASGVVDGAANVTLPTQWQSRQFVTNGTAWYTV